MTSESEDEVQVLDWGYEQNNSDQAYLSVYSGSEAILPSSARFLQTNVDVILFSPTLAISCFKMTRGHHNEKVAVIRHRSKSRMSLGPSPNGHKPEGSPELASLSLLLRNQAYVRRKHSFLSHQRESSWLNHLRDSFTRQNVVLGKILIPENEAFLVPATHPHACDEIF